MFNKSTIEAITKVAKDNDIEPAKLLAIAHKESAGIAFWNIDGVAKPPVRFEGHYFYKRLSGTKLDKAIKEGLASPKAGAVKNPNSFSDRYKLIARARAIDENAALESVSWGLGQVMGAHWKDLGFSSVQELVSLSESVEGQVELMVRFIDANGLRDEVDNSNWAAFAKAYNGPNYKKNRYDTDIAKLYTKYRNSPDTIEADEITQLQNMLNVVYPDYKLKVDGTYGPATKAALRDFQLKNGLKVDGIYGPLSKETLQKKYLELSNAKTATTGVTGAAVGTVGTAITQAAQTIEPFAKTSQVIQWVFIGLLVLGVLVMLKPYIFPKKVS